MQVHPIPPPSSCYTEFRAQSLFELTQQQTYTANRLSRPYISRAYSEQLPLVLRGTASSMCMQQVMHSVAAVPIIVSSHYCRYDFMAHVMRLHRGGAGPPLTCCGSIL